MGNLCDVEPTLKSQNEAREIRTPNLLIWSQTRCRCAIAPLEYLLTGGTTTRVPADSSLLPSKKKLHGTRGAHATSTPVASLPNCSRCTTARRGYVFLLVGWLAGQTFVQVLPTLSTKLRSAIREVVAGMFAMR